MGNIRYQLSESHHENIEAKLLYISSSRYEGDWSSLKHTHYFTELSLCTTPLKYVVLGVEGLSFTFGSNKDYIAFNCIYMKNNLIFYFNSMLAELEHKDKNYELVCQNLLEVLITILLRHTGFAFEIAPAQKITRECDKIKRYIDSNFADEITLDSLAVMAHPKATSLRVFVRPAALLQAL